ncbi:MAG: hypothetical protein ACXWT1_22370, partial [Methylobacter sp.]
QAALVFEAAVRLDESDVDAILENVERKSYISLHWDFIRSSHGLQALVSQYGIDYWKNRALMLMACNQAEEDNTEAESNVMRFFAKIVAMESALFEICNLLKIDIAAIKKMAGCPDDDAKASELPKADEELVKQYTELFTKAAMLN